MTPETRETLQRAHAWLADDPATRWTTGVYALAQQPLLPPPPGVEAPTVWPDPTPETTYQCYSWAQLAEAYAKGELLACCAAGVVGLVSMNPAGNLDYQQIDEALAALADCVAGTLTRDASDALNDVTDWNDAARRTVRHVLDAFQRAADAP